MDKEKRALLAPHAEHFQTMASFVRESSDDELERLLDACHDASQTNCAWDIYAAARHLEKEIRSEQNARTRRLCS